jgi:hypothetical protein
MNVSGDVHIKHGSLKGGAQVSICSSVVLQVYHDNPKQAFE